MKAHNGTSLGDVLSKNSSLLATLFRARVLNLWSVNP